MSYRDAQGRPVNRARKRQVRVRRERLAALGSLIAVVAVLLIVVLSSLGSGSHTSNRTSAVSAHSSTAPTSASAATAKGTASVPILAYHVINVAPAGTSASPTLYVPTEEFSSQMAALKAHGWHAVTLNQLEAYWTRGTSLGPGKPIVITFDDGYASQYTNAVPVLKGLGWVGVENLRLSGLPTSEGGLDDAQIRGLVAAGWELDSEGMTGADLTNLDSGQLSQEVANARQTLRSRYGVAANWFSYPLGHYDATVIAAVRAAGFVGSTTTVSGWASPQQDRFRLPRVEVVGGTTASQLLSQIASAQASTSAPPSFNGTGTT